VKICPACSREYPSESTHCHDDGVALVAFQAGNGARPEELLGQIVDGRYRVERIIGRGGMGVVYACRHVVVGKPAAMKVLRVGVERAEGVLPRFIREAQTANAIRSRHIVEMTDFGQLPNGFCYVVMELLEGMSLTYAMREGRLSRPDLLHVFIQMAEALHLVHAQGIVHRDLKPDNVFLVNENNDPLFVKLLDFGIAKAMHAEVSGLTETGVILGTPYYMSPEQARGEPVDGRTDIYSLGVMMYRAFTGKLPFVAESMLGVLTRHLTEAPAPPSHVTEIDGRTEHVIMRCLEKDPNARFQSTGEIAAALATIAAVPSASGTLLIPQAIAPHGARASYQGTSMSPGASPSYAPQSAPHAALEFTSPSGAFSAHTPPPQTLSSMPHGAPQPPPSSSPSVRTGMYAQPAGSQPRISYGQGASPSGLHPVPAGHTAVMGQGGASGIYGSPAAQGTSGLHAAPGQMMGASGEFDVRSGIHAAPGSLPPGSMPGLPAQSLVPELVTQRGLATSNTGTFAVGAKRSNVLVVGLPLAVVAAGLMIALAILVSRSDGGAGDGVSASAPTGATPSVGQAATVAVTTTAATVAATTTAEIPASAPSSQASAAPSSESSATAASTSKPRHGGGKHVVVKTAEPAAPPPPGKRPEIRSPFD
jgi:serine/threonine-protein kinase